MTNLATALRQGLLWNDESSEPLIGLVARVFILGSLPHSEPGDNEFHRSFGDSRFRLSLFAPRDVGLPYGRLPRLILSHMTTQAVREGTPELVLGRSFRAFCAHLGVPATGGPNGYLAQVKKQVVRLADLQVKASWDTRDQSWVDPDEGKIYTAHGYRIITSFRFPWDEPSKSGQLCVRLSDEFFRLICHKPVPVDVRALQGLQSPMAMDIYVYCTWRSIRALKRNHAEPVPWHELQQQLGSSYTRLRDFRSHFTNHLKTVLRFYPDIRVESRPDCLVIHPYQPHIRRQ